MKLNDIQWQDVTLEPERERQTQQRSIKGLISVGQAEVFHALQLARLGGREIDPQLLMLEATHDFFLIRLPVSIRQVEKLDLRLLGVDFVLKSPEDKAISWSLDPLQVTEETKVKVESKLSSDLKVSPLSIGAGENTVEEFQVRKPIIEAYGLGQSTSGWEFRRKGNSPLSGITILNEVVKVPRKTRCTGTLQLRTDIYEKGLLFNFRARNADTSEDVQRFLVTSGLS